LDQHTIFSFLDFLKEKFLSNQVNLGNLDENQDCNRDLSKVIEVHELIHEMILELAQIGEEHLHGFVRQKQVALWISPFGGSHVKLY
jgi:hypothetical protein